MQLPGRDDKMLEYVDMCYSNRVAGLVLFSGAVDVSAFRFRTVKAEDAAGVLEMYRTATDRNLGEINVVSLF